MINGGETADRMVEYSLRFSEMAVRLSGRATMSLVNYLTALSKDNKKTRGKTRLIRMLKDGKELKVFQINTSQLHEFARLSKTYGILFTALRDKKNPDGLVDLMVKAEDASKVSRALERLKIASYDVGEITATLDRDQAKANPTKGRTTGSRSGNSLPGSDESVRTDDRPSVREQLKQIKTRLKKDRPAISRPNMHRSAHSSKAKPGR